MRSAWLAVGLLVLPFAGASPVDDVRLIVDDVLSPLQEEEGDGSPENSTGGPGPGQGATTGNSTTSEPFAVCDYLEVVRDAWHRAPAEVQESAQNWNTFVTMVETASETTCLGMEMVEPPPICVVGCSEPTSAGESADAACDIPCVEYEVELTTFSSQYGAPATFLRPSDSALVVAWLFGAITPPNVPNGGSLAGYFTWFASLPKTIETTVRVHVEWQTWDISITNQAAPMYQATSAEGDIFTASPTAGATIFFQAFGADTSPPIYGYGGVDVQTNAWEAHAHQYTDASLPVVGMFSTTDFEGNLQAFRVDLGFAHSDSSGVTKQDVVLNWESIFHAAAEFEVETWTVVIDRMPAKANLVIERTKSNDESASTFVVKWEASEDVESSISVNNGNGLTVLLTNPPTIIEELSIATLVADAPATESTDPECQEWFEAKFRLSSVRVPEGPNWGAPFGILFHAKDLTIDAQDAGLHFEGEAGWMRAVDCTVTADPLAVVYDELCGEAGGGGKKKSLDPMRFRLQALPAVDDNFAFVIGQLTVTNGDSFSAHATKLVSVDIDTVTGRSHPNPTANVQFHDDASVYVTFGENDIWLTGDLTTIQAEWAFDPPWEIFFDASAAGGVDLHFTKCGATRVEFYNLLRVEIEWSILEGNIAGGRASLTFVSGAGSFSIPLLSGGFFGSGVEEVTLKIELVLTGLEMTYSWGISRTGSTSIDGIIATLETVPLSANSDLVQVCIPWLAPPANCVSIPLGHNFVDSVTFGTFPVRVTLANTSD